MEDDVEDGSWSRCSAILRIFGTIADLDEITRTLGLIPTHFHRRGDRQRVPALGDYEHDMWSYSPPVPAEEPLDVHIQTLWAHIAPHTDYLLGLKRTLTVDVFCCLASPGAQGIEVSHRSLEMFTRLEVPFGVSLVV
ncbi:DUF4279 domain-containing protein [Paludisphaera mucosa]|uniref:DUF4279 domain-containing protein n=1 Tax=Paludisphaera mucosa TaxID=3030827 RepID=A0ABT6F4F1_9BACT|nr:DUF4279 domain-containing protein [Paludisphaera mucosa]